MFQRTPTFPLLLLLGTALGCQQDNPALTPDRSPAHAWMINSYLDDSTSQAVITQHTLLPYHFVDDSARLNELGQHDLEVLAQHFQDSPGTLNVRQGDASQELYLARVATVRDALAQAGVPTARMVLTDGLPGGEGVTCERVLEILAQEKQDNAAASGSGTSSSSSSTYTSTPINSSSMQGNQP
jgi:hypothetical protein